MRLRCWIPTLFYAALVFSMPITRTAMADVPISDTEANRIIDSLLSLPHGTKFAAPKDRDLVLVLVEHPEVFLPLLSARVETLGPASSEPLEPGRIVRSLGVLGLVTQFGPGKSSRLVNATLRAGFRRADEIRTSSETPDHDRDPPRNAILLSNLDLLCGVTLDMLAEFDNSEAIDEVVEKLGEAEIGLQTVMLRYLEKVAPLRPDIRPKLVEMYQSATSRLRNHPQLLRVLEAIDKAEGGATNETPRAKTEIKKGRNRAKE